MNLTSALRSSHNSSRTQTVSCRSAPSLIRRYPQPTTKQPRDINLPRRSNCTAPQVHHKDKNRKEEKNRRDHESQKQPPANASQRNTTPRNLTSTRTTVKTHDTHDSSSCRISKES
ncbi:hypothetical protein RYX36_018145 [Vicia faba]